MSAAAAVSDPQEAKIALVIDVLSRDDELSTAEIALLDELGRVPEVRDALSQRENRQDWARVEAARAIEARREAERAERIESRRASWRAADLFVRECHVAAERLGPKATARDLALCLARLRSDPTSTLLTRGGVDQFGDRRQRVERAPPVTFEPSGYPADDPVTEETT